MLPCQQDTKIATESNMTVISECGTKLNKYWKKEEGKKKWNHVSAIQIWEVFLIKGNHKR